MGGYTQGHVTSLAEVWIEIPRSCNLGRCFSVTSLAEVWIEIALPCKLVSVRGVTSLAEVWIEIVTFFPF